MDAERTAHLVLQCTILLAGGVIGALLKRLIFDKS
jgi:hypothetical protein